MRQNLPAAASKKETSGVSSAEDGLRQTGPRWATWLFGAALLSCALHLLLTADAMRTSSLWEDEIGTIFRRATEGWNYVLQDYDRARNHLLYNALMMLLPWANPEVEWHMRFVSFVAAFILSVVLVILPLRRHLPMTLLLGFAVWSLNANLLERCFHARGYGLMALAALLQFWATSYHLRAPSFRTYLATLLPLLMGALTTPIYLFYGTPLAFFTFLKTRVCHGLTALAAAGLIILFAWSPMLEDIFLTGMLYRDWFDSSFSLSTIGWGFSNYIFHVPVYSWILLGPLLLLGPWLLRSDTPEGWGSRMGTAAIAVFLTSLLLLGNAPARTLTLIILPLVTCAGIGLDHLVARVSILRNLPIVASIAICLTGLFLSSSYHHVPGEDWKTAARFCRTLLPTGSRLDVSRFSTDVMLYLRDYPLQILAESSETPENVLTQPNSLLLNSPDPLDNQIDLIHSEQWDSLGVDLVLPGRYRPIWLHFVPNAPDLSSCVIRGDQGTDLTSRLMDRQWKTKVDSNRGLSIELSRDAHSILFLSEEGGTDLRPRQMILRNSRNSIPIEQSRFLQIGRAAVLLTEGLGPGTYTLDWNTPPGVSEVRVYRQ